MNKKIIIGSIMAVSLFTNSFAADIVYYGANSNISKINFSDVLSQGDGYWAKPAIYQIASFGIMQGMDNNLFSPLTYVTNEQAIVTIINAKGNKRDVESINMKVNNWSDKYIKYAMNNGIITEKIVYKKADVKGDYEAFKKKGVFIRDIPITREEVASLICRAFSLPSTDSEKKPIDFLDKALIDTSKVSYVDAVSMAGIMVGDESGMFNPKAGLTRAEFAQIFKNCEDYILGDLRLIKRNGFIDSINGKSFIVTDDKGNSIKVDCSSKDIPVLRNNMLSGSSSLRASDEIEFFIDTSKQVVFIRVIDDGIYQDNSDSGLKDNISKQGIVTGNSPYFYEISVKDKNGDVKTYTYGSWTSIYKDGKETNASNILQGDTVYLDFDELGDLVSIRGVTNSVISYGTITNIDRYNVTLKMDKDNSIKKYDLRRVPIYENGVEIDCEDLYNGKYIKLYTSQSELIKAEVVLDERTTENLYKGYISEINLIQDRIILRRPKVLINRVWENAEDSFITIPLDKEMDIIFDGQDLEKRELGEKQVGKFAYIATRQDTKTLEKVKAMNIEFEKDRDTIDGEIKSYSDVLGELRIYGYYRDIFVDYRTICSIDGKIVSPSALKKGDNIFITLGYEDGDYYAKLITSSKKAETRDVNVYYGEITNVQSGEEFSLKIKGIYEYNDWNDREGKHTSFTIREDTRIFDETGAITFKEFNSNYEGKLVCVVSDGDNAVSVGVMDFGENLPYISIGSVKDITEAGFVLYDVESFNHEEGEFFENNVEEKITLDVSSLLVKNGNFARNNEIEKNQEAIVIRKDNASPAGVVLLTD